MATVHQMARFQTYQEQYSNSTNNSTNGSKTTSNEKMYKANAEAHIQSLRDSGYLVEDGDTSYKVIVPISDDVKAQVDAYMQNKYANNQGWSFDGEAGIGEITYAYTQTLEPSERLSAGWSVTDYYFSQSEKYYAKIQETNPGWPYDGSSYDSSIFDDFNPKSVNITA